MPNIANISGNLLTDSGIDLSTLPSGSGTLNYLPKWTSTTTLGNSLVFDNGDDIGIGTTTPTSQGAFRVVSINSATGSILDLMRNGTSQMQIQASSSVNAFAGQTSLPISFQTNGSHRMEITGSTGNVIIGGTFGVDAGFRLDVSGTFRSTGDANINGLTVGKGGGSVSTNTAVGSSALSANTTGTLNVALGTNALQSNITGLANTALGYESLKAYNSANGANVAVGYWASLSNTSGTANTIVGAEAQRYGSSGSNQTALGYRALWIATGGTNTALGYQAAQDLTTGTNNIIIGGQTTGVTTGSNNTLIGAVTGLSSSLSNTIILADGQGNQRIVVNSSNQIGLGGQPVAPYPVHITAVSGYGLAVRNSTTTTKQTQINDGSIVLGDGSGNYATIENVGTSGLLRYTSALHQIRIGSTNAIYIPATANVLIGTTTDAGYKLDVNGTARVSGLMTLGNNLQMPWGSNKISFPFSTGASYDFGISFDGNRTMNIFAKAADNLDAIIFSTGSSSTEKMRLTSSGSFGIGTSSPNASALLDVSSTTKGVLLPRMTGAQAEAIATPADGLVVYVNSGNGVTITSTGFWGRDAGAWVKLS